MGGIRKGIWIARDQNGNLYAYVAKPKMYTNSFTEMDEFAPRCIGKYGRSVMRLPDNWYKSIKFKKNQLNSPVFVPLTEAFVKQFIKN